MASTTPPDSAAAVAAVEEYHEGFRLRVHVRGDAGLVVTQETGRNRFRQWDRELVTYLLGREGGRWRLVGYFIKDIANPK